jgi:hypothetical protein
MKCDTGLDYGQKTKKRDPGVYRASHGSVGPAMLPGRHRPCRASEGPGKGLWCTLLLSPLFLTCIGFTKVERVNDGRTLGEPVSPNSGAEINVPRKQSVRLHFVGWSYFPEDRRQVEEALTQQGFIIDPDSDPLLEITLEQTYLTHPLQKVGNVVLFIASLTLIPLYERYDYSVRFALREGANRRLIREYGIRTRIYSSLVVAPLTYLWWPPTERAMAVEKAAMDFGLLAGEQMQ